MPRFTPWCVLLAALIVIAGGAAPTPARAAQIDIGCAWNAISVQTRQALLAVAPDSKKMGDIVGNNDAEFRTAARQCQIPLDGPSGEHYFQAVAAKILMEWSTQQLQPFGVDAAALDGAWLSLPAAERVSIGADVLAGRSASPSEAAEFHQLMDNLGVKTDAGRVCVAYYIAGRAILDAVSGP